MQRNPTVTEQNQTKDELWCVHVIGPDDVYACRSKAHAVLMAEDINAKLRQWAGQHPDVAVDPNIPQISAVVAAWPHSASEHAKGLLP